ncbi:hypothetical protein ACFX1W_006839 [Malus domestica]
MLLLRTKGLAKVMSPTYYGMLKDVVEIQYTNALKFVLFKCDWVNALGGVKEDEFKFTLVNFNHLEGVDGATVDINVEEVDGPPENEMEE